MKKSVIKRDQRPYDDQSRSTNLFEPDIGGDQRGVQQFLNGGNLCLQVLLHEQGVPIGVVQRQPQKRINF